MRRGVVLAMAMVLVTAGCGNGGAELTVVSTPPSSGLDPAVCDLLDDENPSEEFVAALPNDLRDAGRLMLDAIEAIDLNFDINVDLGGSATPGSTTSTPGPTGMAPDVLERLTASGVSDRFQQLADALSTACGPGDAVDGVQVFARATALAEPASDPDYCEQLADLTTRPADDFEASWFEDLIGLAPVEHSDALASLATVAAGDTATDPSGLTELAGDFAGIGLYSEARCGVDGAFSIMLFAGAMAGLAFGGESVPGSGGGADPVGDVAAEAPVADATTANGLVPASFGLIFEVRALSLDDGDYNVSLVVPAGWEQADSGFGITFEPNGDNFGFFTEMEADTGCDGLCQRTDWEQRLTGSSGYLTSYRSTRTFTVDRPVAGSAGVVLVSEDEGFGVEGLVARWDDGADKYFVCEFRLDDGDDVVVDAFVAACESSRPGWFPVS